MIDIILKTIIIILLMCININLDNISTALYHIASEIGQLYLNKDKDNVTERDK